MYFVACGAKVFHICEMCTADMASAGIAMCRLRGARGKLHICEMCAFAGLRGSKVLYGGPVCEALRGSGRLRDAQGDDACMACAVMPRHLRDASLQAASA